MKKIPTLFHREYENHKVCGILPLLSDSSLSWVLDGEGVATVKIDGSCCAIINGEFYKRYDAKKGKKPPVGAIPCQDAPDPVTGRFPHWVKCDRDNPADKWFWAAYDKAVSYAVGSLPDGTYEAIGQHFQGNPYNLGCDILEKHGSQVIAERFDSFNAIMRYLDEHYIEGIVFWKDGEPRCKIKRSDFGYSWGGGGK